jgi:hypothetical protein
MSDNPKKHRNEMMVRFTPLCLIIVLMNVAPLNAEPGRFRCRATSISDFADDPIYRKEKAQAIKSAEDFIVDTRSGVVKNVNGQTESWHVIEKGNGNADAVLMREKNYKTLPIDEFLSIIHWSDTNDDRFHFERSVLDGMVSGACSKSG